VCSEIFPHARRVSVDYLLYAAKYFASIFYRYEQLSKWHRDRFKLSSREKIKSFANAGVACGKHSEDLEI
jgi:hypothetical protein